MYRDRNLQKPRRDIVLVVLSPLFVAAALTARGHDEVPSSAQTKTTERTPTFRARREHRLELPNCERGYKSKLRGLWVWQMDAHDEEQRTTIDGQLMLQCAKVLPEDTQYRTSPQKEMCAKARESRGRRQEYLKSNQRPKRRST